MSTVHIGIQGGKGSFNEEAINYYVERTRISNFELHYLHTTENVLTALENNEINLGQFAIHNSIGGIVQESIHALAQHQCIVEEQFAIKISHALMVKHGASLSNIKQIMTHPQVLAQCKDTLANKYPSIKKTSGEGELIDHALVAEKLSTGELENSIATIGSSLLAELFNLDVIEENLQDMEENYTSFLVVKHI